MSAQAGTVKRNTETGDVAVRTTFDEATLPNMAWLVATIGMGARNASSTEVDGWDELYTAPAPASQTQPTAVENRSAATK